MSTDEETDLAKDVRDLRLIIAGPTGKPQEGLAFQVKLTQRDIAGIKTELGSIKKIGWGIIATIISTVLLAVLNLVIRSQGG